MDSVIDVIDVTKRYGPSRGVQGVSFSVRRGEVLGLLGPNGAGKTTTLRVITGFLPANGGRVLVEGHDIWEEPYEVRRRIGYLPDNPPLYPEMTVYEYLNFMGQLHELPAARRGVRIDEVAERLQLGDVLGRLIGRLSRGYRQRVGLAQAVLHEPPVLICDEPTVGLDPRQIAEMRELIRSFGQEHAVIFSSHILHEVRLLCSEIVIIHRGQVVTQGSPQDLTERLHGGTTQWLVRAKGPGDAVAAALRSVPGVHAVQEQPSPEGEAETAGVVRLLVEAGSTGGEDLADRLFGALAAGGWPARELRQLETSLEDVFLELTAAEQASSTTVAEPAHAKAGPQRGGGRR